MAYALSFYPKFQKTLFQSTKYFNYTKSFDILTLRAVFIIRSTQKRNSYRVVTVAPWLETYHLK